MRLLAFFTFSLIGFHALAQTDSEPKRAVTALGALKLVPQDQAANLVSIVAREGDPSPERWYLITYDASEDSGVREFVVSGSNLIASRTISQFTRSLKPADVLGKGGLRIDSDKASQIAYEYGQANSLAISSINYELKQEGQGGPAWNLVCLDKTASRLGELKVAADSGVVLSHEGFSVEPAPPQVKVAQAVQARETPQPAAAHPSPPKKKEEAPPKGLGGKLKRYFFSH